MNKTDISLFIVRIVLGLTFLVHGVEKFQMGLGNVAGFFESLGVPGMLAYIVGPIEMIGGIAMLLGLGTRVVGVLFAIIMVGAITIVKWDAGLLGNETSGGYELDLLLLAVSVQMAMTGSRMLSLDHFFTREKQSTISS
ncbi:DoxX family protein [Caldalkalibacillus salinus]|uniref:DoxX family protein n=1 Tax=Caldalkalibacillus salinus TaxID=2803787 RepID=UPI001922464C|nr:DoxX family protein [Caldalkalibacillus salinus]